MPEQATKNYAGLDISKDQLDYCINESDEGRFSNNELGWVSLNKKLKTCGRPCVVCEASGGYEKAVVAQMLSAGLEVCVVQPGRVRAYAYAQGILAKTDRIDARLLRRFGQDVKPRLAVPVDASSATLRELLEHRRQLSDQIVKTNCRLDVAGKTLQKLLKRELSFLESQLEIVDGMIKEHIDNDPDLRGKSERLQQIKGVGPVLAATILAYVPEIGRLEDRALSALVGVAPHPKDSGKRKAPRHIRGGRSQVRQVLYMAAVSASQHNEILMSFYQRLISRGKTKMSCLVAVMRKMLCVMNRLLRDPNFCPCQ